MADWFKQNKAALGSLLSGAGAILIKAGGKLQPVGEGLVLIGMFLGGGGILQSDAYHRGQ